MISDAVLRAELLKTPKRVPSALLYDKLGSTLFEAITMLPEYPLTRVGMRLLFEHRGEVVSSGSEFDVVELGPGSGKMALVVLEALRHRQRHIRFSAIDVSEHALQSCQRMLTNLEGVHVQMILDDYISGLQKAAIHRTPGLRTLVLFLGSNISNFDRSDAVAFLREVRTTLVEGDAFLMAMDLDKPPADLLRAYDDALGVTAAFNKNVLGRLNREWNANFPLDRFVHRSEWNAEQRRIEMHLVATTHCVVEIPALDCTLRFEAGESLWTESSYRFSLSDIEALARNAGFRITHQWVDDVWPFAQTLLKAI